MYFYKQGLVSKLIPFSGNTSHRINRVHGSFNSKITYALNQLTKQNVDSLSLFLASRDIYGKNVKTHKA
ncbi:hypothetical protein bcere0015_47860 [Bacillus cereus BDRD-Cer4]|nr:hypothetical protein bcere0015_47860 [Bacillus cereus BDRD-Cer4]